MKYICLAYVGEGWSAMVRAGGVEIRAVHNMVWFAA